MHMKTPNNLRGEPEKLPDKEVMHLITKLFALREDRLKKTPEDQAALNFYRNLPESMSLTSQCNLNRK